MGKVPVRLKEVVYTLSPFQQSVMSGLWKDMPHKTAHYMSKVRRISTCTKQAVRLVCLRFSPFLPVEAIQPCLLSYDNTCCNNFLQAREIATWFGLPLYGVVYYCQDYKEKEKQEHRF